jgi:hypothetical protein
MSFRNTFKERSAGFLLLCAIVPLALLGYLLIVFHGLFGRTASVRSAVRALDHFVNASVFGGHAWDSLSPQPGGKGIGLGLKPWCVYWIVFSRITVTVPTNGNSLWSI